MENSLIKSPMQYLNQATGTLRDLGITPVRPDFTPINALLEKISDLDHDRIAVISRTLGQTEVFNEVVRDQTQAMDIGRRDLARGDVAAARKTAQDMAALRDDLRAEFTLRIVNRPGEASGVWREPLINRGGRNDYLIVEAVAPGGKIFARPILNEETGITSTVNKWGVRVSNDTFEKVMADKRDNGIIERNIVGQKKRGFLDADYSMPVLGGTITNW